MRAIWSQEVLHRNAAADWRFTRADADDIRAGLRSRLAAAGGEAISYPP